MTNYIEGKSIIVTGAGSGFGKLLSEKAAAADAHVTCVDINAHHLDEVVGGIIQAKGIAQAVVADVSDIDAMRAMSASAVAAYGRIDVIVNNAGVMPLAFYADHQHAIGSWHKCIDINLKGVLNGIVSVYDQMMAQGEGHVVNVSSIYSHHPVAGAGVYQATKIGVRYLSESLRVEAQGKIKVTVIRPTGVPGTGLGAGMVDPKALVGIAGQNTSLYLGEMHAMMGGSLDPALLDKNTMGYIALDPAIIADNILYAINQPKGVSIGDMTIRSSGEHFIL
ncbi:SDR family NAD(P)-dependent oxidoreductase [Sphingobium sp. HBC34]|uniref:SDR family NAD(P)-dependent oxidoreductase n=1 Tax=Sphingobium cyanobacteriorum TaxID=3063954 RepID=A0ABT8ZQI4_9SPHN|nr:SDR family NAD(P)-dependent oxidoreductase [Sphingobium sp. HBC34]MDO7836451.1 SDR family NAD(P)-dependent oxidoreductase [Sphingobium sp. HBC34]